MLGIAAKKLLAALLTIPNCFKLLFNHAGCLEVDFPLCKSVALDNLSVLKYQLYVNSCKSI